MQTTGGIDGGLGSGGGIRLWCLTGSLKYVIQQMMEGRVCLTLPHISLHRRVCPPGATLTWWWRTSKAPPPAPPCSTRPSAAVYPD